MAVLQNPKHEVFARAIAKGEKQIAAYEKAGYVPELGHAARLAANPSIVARVTELQKRAAARAEINQAWVLKKLVSNAVLARKLGQIGASTQALALIGKAMPGGMFTDRKELSGPNGAPLEVNAQLRVDISRLSETQVLALEDIIKTVSIA